MACVTICKILLIVLNAVFLLVSLAFLAVGIIITFMLDLFIDDIYEKAKEEAASNGYTIAESVDDIKEFPLLSEIGIACIVLGVALFVITALGFCGSCCSSCCRLLLIVYSIIVVILVVIELALFCLFFVTDSPLHDELKGAIKDKIDTDYDEKSNNSFTAAIIILHREFDCCGMDGVADFGNKTHKSCDAAYESIGCYGKMQDEIEDNEVYAGLGAAGLLALQLLEVYAAVTVYKDASAKINPW